VQPKLILDIGFYHGASALSVACKSVQVHTYDIIPLEEIGNAYSNLLAMNSNLFQEIGDLAVPGYYGLHKPKISDADLVTIDGPKDGVFE
jgi:hypothetical protein